MIPKNISLADGVDLLVCRDNRFKTARLTAAMFLPLCADTAAAYALLPDLLTHATAQYPDMTSLNRRLSRLYGASVGGNVLRFGEHQVLTLTVSCIDDRFALHGEAVMEEAAQLLLSMLFSPHLSADGCFDETDFLQEKRCLVERIAAEYNDKRLYARMRCDRLLAGGEAYGVPATGTADAAAALTRETVTAAWKTVLRTAKIQWLYTADSDGATIAAALRAAFAGRVREVSCGHTVTAFSPLTQPRRETETQAVNQVKLSMGFRLPACEPHRKQVAAGRLLAALYGGTPHSLLFRHVREEKSLCYYCHAGYDRVKGVMTVDSGVDAGQLPAAEEEILRQLDAVRAGQFTDEDLAAARRSLENALRENENTQSGIIGWYMGQSLFLPFLTPEETIGTLRAVSRDDICALAREVNLQSVFTLLPEKGESV